MFVCVSKWSAWIIEKRAANNIASVDAVPLPYYLGLAGFEVRIFKTIRGATVYSYAYQNVLHVMTSRYRTFK